MPNAKQYHCKAKLHKDTKFSLKVGTIFEDSRHKYSDRIIKSNRAMISVTQSGR